MVSFSRFLVSSWFSPFILHIPSHIERLLKKHRYIYIYIMKQVHGRMACSYKEQGVESKHSVGAGVTAEVE